MQKFVVLVVFLGLLSIPLMAQDSPKVEVFGGWEYQHLGGDLGPLSMPEGWNASGTFNLSKHFGVAADLGASYKTVSGTFVTLGGAGGTGTSTLHVTTYTFGPVISMDSAAKINPFAHFLIGGAHFSQTAKGCGVFYFESGCGSASASLNGFSMMLGGGVDAKLNKSIAIRLAQFDWVYYHAEGQGEGKNVRLSSGVVIRF